MRILITCAAIVGAVACTEHSDRAPDPTKDVARYHLVWGVEGAVDGAVDVARDLVRMQQACDDGQMRVCARLAFAYEEGLTVVQDVGNLGTLYERGAGVEKDIDLAASFFDRACAGGVCAIGLLQMFTGIVEAVSYALLRQDKDGVSHQELAQVFD